METFVANISDSITAIAVTETWLTEQTEKDFFLPGYDFVIKCRKEKIGGGVGIFIFSNLNYFIRSDLCRMSIAIECLFIEINQVNRRNIVIGCIYRPPNADRNTLDTFNNELCDILNILDLGKNKTILLAGDYNLDLIKQDSHEPTADFFNNLVSHSFTPCIQFPTRITDVSSTLIDNIFINATPSMFDSVIIYNDISDHLPIAVHMSAKLALSVNKPEIKSRFYSATAIETFNYTLANDHRWLNLQNMFQTRIDPNTAYNYFYAIYLDVFEKCFPEKVVKISRRRTPIKDWMTKGILRSCNKRSTLYRTYKNSGSQEDKNKYIKYRNKLQSIILKTKQNYYCSQFAFISGNLRQTWKLLQKITQSEPVKKDLETFVEDGIEIINKNDIANKFNQYFVNIGERLAGLIPNSSVHFSTFLKKDYTNSLCLFPTDASEIINIVMKFENKSSFGYDNIPVRVMKASIYNIAEYVSNLVNCSLSSGIFPDQLKIAKVCPIFKDGERNLFSNYRPISILSSFSKIFEKVVFNRVTSYLEENNILFKGQYGFRKRHSTYMALLDMYDKISTAIDRHEYAVGIFIDLSKAFDTLDHSILLKKLQHYGIRGITLSWFNSYLCNRKQYVYLNGVSSTMQLTQCGVPQGSILGPLLFILYVNDIANCSDILWFILFADDTNVFHSESDVNKLTATLNNELTKLSIWFKANKLSLNAKKTKYMIFGSRYSMKNYKLSLCLDSNYIERVEFTKFLGVLVDEKLTWQRHIDHIKTKISRGLGIMSRARQILPRKVLVMLYYSLVYPYLVYCNIIWGTASPSYLNKILILQKRAVRLCTGSSYRSTSSPLFKELCMLKIADINKMYTVMFMFNCKLKLLPNSCFDFVSLANNNRIHDTRNTDFFKVEHFRTNIREKFVTVRGSKLWNSLPISIQSSSNYVQLKKLLRSYFINMY